MKQVAGHREQVAMALTAMAEGMNEEMDANRLNGYLAILGDVELELLEPALVRLARQQRWFPKPSQVLEETQTLARDRRAKVKQLEPQRMADQEREKVQQHLNDFKEKMGWK